MANKQVALYLRVSTHAQSTDAQLAELRQLVERRGWKYKVFCDKGQSGAKESRPAFGGRSLLRAASGGGQRPAASGGGLRSLLLRHEMSTCDRSAVVILQRYVFGLLIDLRGVYGNCWIFL